MENLIDITGSRHLNKAHRDREIKKIFSKIDELLSVSQISKITLTLEMFSNIISHFPQDIKENIEQGFLYKKSVVVPLRMK